MNRRDVFNIGAGVAALSAAGAFTARDARAASQSRYTAAFALLDRYVEQYMRDMNAPGMTLALADASGLQRVCAYGLDDLARRKPLEVDDLFHIGSITKSFLAVALLQLRDEGRLDLGRPIAEYLPWIRFVQRRGLSPPMTC